MLLRSTIIIFLLFVLFPANGEAKGSIYDVVVGGTIKTLARVFVKTSNLPKLKAKYIKKIITMREDKFQKYYGKFFVVYKQLPDNIKQYYVFTENTSKTDVINMIDQVNKRDLLKIINKVPSEFIMQQTRQYYHPSQDHMPGNTSVNETFLWKKLIQKI